jgi:hypothetical protein
VARKTQAEAQPSDLIPRLEAARLAGKHVRTIDRRIKNGLLIRYTREGSNKIYVSRAEVHELFALRPIRPAGGGPALKR